MNMDFLPTEDLFCNSENVIYLIPCEKWQEEYIGLPIVYSV